MIEEGFELPVRFDNKDFAFPARLSHWGFGYKIEVDVEELSIVFEPDEDRNWRAIVDPSVVSSNRQISKALLEAIANAIENITR